MLNLDTALCRLSDIAGNEDVRSLSYAKFPGTHCPLFGVAMIASFVSDLAVLVVGTGECTYYSKGFARVNQGDGDNFYSLVIGKHDLTFGCGKKVLAALRQIDRDDSPAAIMVVTTCVLEVIGEDMESLLLENEGEFSARLLLVQTEHFKCGSHIPGMERALASFAGLMARCPQEPRSINILGHRKHGVERTEVIAALAASGVTVREIIPSNCRIADLQRAAGAALNVVTDFTALPLARAMEKRLGIPFVYFGRHLNGERIEREYRRIEELFGISLLAHLDGPRTRLAALEASARALLKGKRFIYGNTPLMAFEVCDYLSGLGMEPVFIQVREYYEEERPDMDRLLARGINPPVAQIANIAPMQEVYDLLRPDMYIGHENPFALFKKGIVQVTVDDATEKIGYEVPVRLLETLLEVCREAMASPDRPAGLQSGVMGQMMAAVKRPQAKGRPGADEWMTRLEKLADGSALSSVSAGQGGQRA